MKAVSGLGFVVAHGNGWRVKVFGVVGPTRKGQAGRRKAEGDLVWVRQASTRDEMQQRLRDMLIASGQPAAPSVAVGPPEQASAAPSVMVAPAAPSVSIVPLQQVGSPGPPRKRLRQQPSSSWSSSHTWSLLMGTGTLER